MRYFGSCMSVLFPKTIESIHWWFFPSSFIIVMLQNGDFCVTLCLLVDILLYGWDFPFPFTYYCELVKFFKYNMLWTISLFIYFDNHIVPVWAVETASGWNLVLWHAPFDFWVLLTFWQTRGFLGSSCTFLYQPWLFL